MIERLFVEQGIKRVELEDFLRKELDKAGFTKAEILKTPMVTRIVISVVKPGLAIGRSGQNIRTLTETIEKRFGLENTQLEIKEIENPNLDAAAVANKMKALIEMGFSWRSIVYRILKDIVDSGAEGVEIIIGGKLTGKGGRKRSQRIIYGYMKKVGDQARLVDFAKVAAYTRAGAIGLKVRIVRPKTVFPDKINIKEYLLGKEKIAEEKKKAEEAVEKAKELEAEAESEKAVEPAEKPAETEEVKQEAKEAKPEKDGKKPKKTAEEKKQKEKHEKAKARPKEKKGEDK